MSAIGDSVGIGFAAARCVGFGGDTSFLGITGHGPPSYLACFVVHSPSWLGFTHGSG